jgi:Sulfotransferase family
MNGLDYHKKLQKARQCMARKEHTEALNLYAVVVKQYPQGGGEYGRAAADAGDFDLAYRVWEKFLTQHAENAPLIARVAGEFQSIGLHAKARGLFARAAELEPRNLELQLNLAALLARTNGFDQARPAVNRCLELDAHHERARYLSAHLQRREGKLEEAEKQLRELIASASRDAAVSYSCRAELSHILDCTGGYDEAMACLAEGKKQARENFNLEAERRDFYERHNRDVREAVSLPKDILSVWAKTFPPPKRNVVAPLAFLSGSARSGTTLLERVLDAHPAVIAWDEPPAFQTIRPHIELSAAAMPAQRLNVLRERYLKHLLLDARPLHRERILLDKNPSRTVWLPPFLRLFPELRVLIALRDPRDVMISLYFQDHVRTNYLTFEQLAEHYRGVMDVWLAVREWEGLVWMETRYEDMVADLRKEGARVTKFLGLEWHEDQAAFYERNREKPVMSSNYHQVTRPVYASSVGRWRAYEKHLAPILPLLEPYCKKFGYG